MGAATGKGRSDLLREELTEIKPLLPRLDPSAPPDSRGGCSCMFVVGGVVLYRALQLESGFSHKNDFELQEFSCCQIVYQRQVRLEKIKLGKVGRFHPLNIPEDAVLQFSAIFPDHEEA